MNLKITLIIMATAVLFADGLAQQKVDIDPNSRVYEGGFFRGSVGITPGKISYIRNDVTEIPSASLTPLFFDFNFGKRINRGLAAYFKITGRVLLKEASNFSTYSLADMGLGANIYLRNSNYYIAPEIALAILHFEYESLPENKSFSPLSDPGLSLTLKSGSDWHLFGNTFIGTQVFLTYARTWYMDTDENPAINYTSTNLFYGVSLSLKFGK